MITTYDSTNTGALAFISDLLESGGNATFNIHGVSDEDLLAMLGWGAIDSLSKTSRDNSGEWYLVGKQKVGDVEFTLFGDTHGEIDPADEPRRSVA